MKNCNEHSWKIFALHWTARKLQWLHATDDRQYLMGVALQKVLAVSHYPFFGRYRNEVNASNGLSVFPSAPQTYYNARERCICSSAFNKIISPQTSGRTEFRTFIL